MRPGIRVACWMMMTAPILTGCVGAAVGAGATVGVAATEERGVGGALSDDRVQFLVSKQLLDQSWTMFHQVDVTVHEGRVLLAGSVPTPTMRVEAVRLAWATEGVRQVHDELKIGGGGGVGGYVTDSWISTQLNSSLLFDRDIQSQNYAVETVDGVVYLMGVAQNQAELNRVTGYARNIGSVRQVVSYVRLKGQPIGPINSGGSYAGPPGVPVPPAPDPNLPPPATIAPLAPTSVESMPLAAPGKPPS